jgi:hypothetical protein
MGSLIGYLVGQGGSESAALPLISYLNGLSADDQVVAFNTIAENLGYTNPDSLPTELYAARIAELELDNATLTNEYAAALAEVNSLETVNQLLSTDISVQLPVAARNVVANQVELGGIRLTASGLPALRRTHSNVGVSFGAISSFATQSFGNFSVPRTVDPRAFAPTGVHCPALTSSAKTLTFGTAAKIAFNGIGAGVLLITVGNGPAHDALELEDLKLYGYSLVANEGPDSTTYTYEYVLRGKSVYPVRKNVFAIQFTHAWDYLQTIVDTSLTIDGAVFYPGANLVSLFNETTGVSTL